MKTMSDVMNGLRAEELSRRLRVQVIGVRKSVPAGLSRNWINAQAYPLQHLIMSFQITATSQFTPARIE